MGIDGEYTEEDEIDQWLNLPDEMFSIMMHAVILNDLERLEERSVRRSSCMDDDRLHERMLREVEEELDKVEDAVESIPELD